MYLMWTFRALRSDVRERSQVRGQARVSSSEPDGEVWLVSAPRRSMVLKSETRRAVNNSDCGLPLSKGRPEPLFAPVVPRPLASMLSRGVPNAPADALCRLPTHCENSVCSSELTSCAREVGACNVAGDSPAPLSVLASAVSNG